MPKTIKIVIRENVAPEEGFGVFLEGDTDRLGGDYPHASLSTAEQWAARLFRACIQELRDAGVIQNEIQNHRSPKEGMH